MLRSIKQLACSIAALTVIGAGSAHAQADCPRGELHKAYLDRDSDLVADAPTDPKQLVDPSTLIFAYTPVEDPAVYARVWDGFVKHMEKVTGKKVVFFPVQSNAAEIEAMRSGRLHVAGFNTGSNPIAVNCAGFVPMAIMAGKDGRFGYEMEIIVPADSSIKTPADIKGKKLAFTAPTSNSGFKAPSVLLESEFKQHRRRLESGVRRRRGEGELLALDVGRCLDARISRHDDLHLVAKAPVLAGHDRHRHEAGAVHRDWIRACVEAGHMKAA